MVTSPHPLASAAGAAVLDAGGNAIEAAVATAAVLAVTMPHFCGLGGDAVWLVADRQGRKASFLGIGAAAQTLPAYDQPVPLRGPGSAITSAAAVDSWQHALDYGARHWGGQAGFSALIAPAIQLAEEGYAPTASQGFWLDFRDEEIAQWPGFCAIFDHRGRSGPFRQPQLAESLRLLARDGARSFYEGELARRIADGLLAAGSPLTLQDLAQTRTRTAEPATLDYRGLTLLAPPPPTQGISTLAILGILSRFDLKNLPAEGSARYHLIVEAVKQAFLDRGQIADGDVEAITASCLDRARLDAKAAAIQSETALSWPHPYQHGDTVFFGVVDGKGNSASVLQSTYFDWGSGVVVGDTGILWQNRGAAFSIDPAHPNAVAPGKRPFYTLNPGMALKDGRPHLIYGTQGADGQPQTLAVLLTGLIDHGMSPHQALAQPRFLLGKTFSDSRDSLKLEASLPHAVINDMSACGHVVAPLAALSPLFGQAGAIRIEDSGDVIGAHDPRGEGLAVAAQNRPG
ncbi:gamma-glutamyltranspeptidase/glutathione hydrolase [Neorhizobium galegae]|uniref:gamma-glutamyltransferase family protein n=1 Tax=Neorhizobium galegae TaxID=399 RepID=UPI001AE53456|nr:gamma-glutamyltransferase [Neorhizobium galegae]MBP2550892.1 gamma-glutamyltranspeptidase/glutathione hydrolase [Neorhizobium galegae]